MRSSFFAFNIARSGIQTARSNLAVTAHNVANFATDGFSRQVTNQRAGQPLSFQNSRGMFGTGSRVYNISQMRDEFLDRRYWQQQSILGEFSVKAPQLQLIEAVFNCLNPDREDDTGIRTAFNDFFSHLREWSRDAHDPTFRQNVAMTGDALTRMIRDNAEALRRQQQDLNHEILAVVTEINSLGQQIANLNSQIRSFEWDGSNANDLRDQRALLIDQLSKHVNVEVREFDFSAESGVVNDVRFTILVNGDDFVNQDRVRRLEVRSRDLAAPHNPMDAPGLYDLFWDTGVQFNMYSRSLTGTLKGLIDVRDGNGGQVLGQPTTNFKGIPFYQNRINEMIRVFARAVNEGRDANGNEIPSSHGGHLGGFDLDGNRGEHLFFQFEGWDASIHGLHTGDNPNLYNYFNAFNFSINQALIDNPRLLAAAIEQTQGESANCIIQGFIDLADNPTLFREGKLIDFIIATSSHLAIDTHQATRFRSSYTEMTLATQNQRLSISGVDMNEEMLNMARFNQLLQANARMMGAINEIYDTLINRLGI